MSVVKKSYKYSVFNKIRIGTVGNIFAVFAISVFINGNVVKKALLAKIINAKFIFANSHCGTGVIIA